MYNDGKKHSPRAKTATLDHALGQTGHAGRDYGRKVIWFDKDLNARLVFADNRMGPPNVCGTRQMVYAGDIAVGVEWNRNNPGGLFIINKGAVLSKPDNMGRINVENDLEQLKITDAEANSLLDKLFEKHTWLEAWLVPCEAGVVRLPEAQFSPDDYFLNAKKREKVESFLERFGLTGLVDAKLVAKEPRENLFLDPMALNFDPRSYRSVCISQGDKKQHEAWYGSNGDGSNAVPLDFTPSLDKGGDVNQPGSTGIGGTGKHAFLVMVRTGHRMTKDKSACVGIMIKVFDAKMPEVRQPGRNIGIASPIEAARQEVVDSQLEEGRARAQAEQEAGEAA